jgi:NAD(P)-dependent dehydrogenase (short-subunit alcohol dehydrogenase family)
MSRLADRVALVTGAASGIGAAIAERLARDGCAGVVLVDRDAEGLAQVNDTVAGLGANALVLAQDVGDPEAWARAEAAIRRSFDRLDLAVANAGVGAYGPVAELPFDAWRRAMSANLDGAFLTLSTAMRLIGEGGRGGSIVVNASVIAAKAEIGVAAYAASKAGAAQLAKVAAKEGAAQRIRVNALLPGGVETPIWRGVPMFEELVASEGSEQAAFARMGQFNPLGRYASAEEIAGLAVFLLSDDCGYVTGASLVCDGGYLL